MMSSSLSNANYTDRTGSAALKLHFYKFHAKTQSGALRRLCDGACEKPFSHNNCLTPDGPKIASLCDEKIKLNLNENNQTIFLSALIFVLAFAFTFIAQNIICEFFPPPERIYMYTYVFFCIYPHIIYLFLVV